MAYADFLIAPRDLHSHLDDPGWRIVDCRFEIWQPEKGHEDYLSAHIPGAVYAHLDRDLAAPVTPSSGRHPLPAPAVFAVTLGRWGIAPDTAVVVYDQGGGAIAARLWWMLRWLGHGTVLMLDGGFEAWRRAGLETSTDIRAIEPTTYPAAADHSMIVSTAELPGLLERGEVLVDAREAERYAGMKEPIDPVAGRVPGASNFPFRNSLQEDGTWRSGEELQRAWAPHLGSRPGRAWITMCGSGVTACHLAVSAQLAGFRAPRLYVGSFSEWIRDRRRPVAGGPGEGGEGGAAGPL